MPRTQPTLSVLMTVYNGGEYLAPALDSILSQDWRQFDLIVVDDGSFDDTPKVLRRYASKDNRVKVLTQANRGISAAANAGLAQCTGTYIARVDADDLALPGRFRHQLAFMERRKVVACGGHVDMIDQHGRLLTTVAMPEDHETIDRLGLVGHCAIFHTTSMIRRDALEKIGGYSTDLDCAVDLDLWLRLAEVGRLVNMPQRLGQLRLHDKSISEQRREHQREMSRKACERAWKRRGVVTGRFEAEAPWRPGTDPDSRCESTARYGWWAFNNGERKTAMLYACKAINAAPWRSPGWKLLAGSLLRSPPTSMRRAG